MLGSVKPIVKIVKLDDQDRLDLEFWLARPIEERVATVELLRAQMYPNETPPRLQRVYKRVALGAR